MGIPTTAAPSSLAVWDVLNTNHNMTLYAIADGAANAYIHAHLQAHDVPHVALYKHEDLKEEQFPWLFPLTPGDIVSEWYLQQSPAQNWGIQLAAPMSLSALADHLMPFIIMQEEQGTLHLMRFYDPRVTNAFLNALTDKQRQDFFKPGLQLWTDAPGLSDTWLHYQQANNPANPQHDYSRTRIDLNSEQTCSDPRTNTEPCSC